MKKVGLKLKTIVASKSSDQESISKLSDKVLGYLYNPVEDRLGIKFVFNPAKKRKGAKVCPDLKLKVLTVSSRLHNQGGLYSLYATLSTTRWD